MTGPEPCPVGWHGQGPAGVRGRLPQPAGGADAEGAGGGGRPDPGGPRSGPHTIVPLPPLVALILGMCRLTAIAESPPQNLPGKLSSGLVLGLLGDNYSGGTITWQGSRLWEPLFCPPPRQVI